MINTNDIPMLDRITSNKDSYKKKEYYKGYKIPIISDTMFKTMLNNTNRTQYASLLIAITLNKDYEEVYNNIEYVKEAKRASTNDEIVGLYDKELHEEKLRITELEEARNEGEKSDIAIGEKKRLAIGEKKGIIETAKNMLKKKLDIDLITECTGLSKKEINNLK